MKNSILTKSQKLNFSKHITYYGVKSTIYVTVRYDDQCGNGHNSFSITGDIYSNQTGNKNDRYFQTGGCIHEEIKKHFPELKHLIKWHLMSSYEPLHYVANTMYHAKDREDMTKPLNAPTSYIERLKFKDFPITFGQSTRGFFDFIKGLGKQDIIDLVIEEIEHKDNEKGGYQYASKFTYQGFVNGWAYCPFDTFKEALEFKEALILGFEFIQIPSTFNKAVEPNLQAARSSAIWHDATLEQLQNKDLLLERLPALIEEFVTDIEALGLVY